MFARFAVLVVSGLAVALPSAVARADNPQLVASVGFHDAFTITLKDANGNLVKHLDPGTYSITVHDYSSIHSFDLFGPGVKQATDIDGIGDAQWVVTFQDGATYTYQCDAHPTEMHGSFTAGAVTPPPPPTKLSGSVGPGRKISLRYAAGGKVGVLTGSNKVVLTVSDHSKTDNFHLKGRGVNKATGVAFRGKVTWRLTLTPGARYTYRSDRHAKLHGSFTVPPAS
jgi:phage baseplate assembly protein gpV